MSAPLGVEEQNNFTHNLIKNSIVVENFKCIKSFVSASLNVHVNDLWIQEM